MDMSEKFTEIAQNTSKVYESGRKSVLNQSKLIPKAVSGSHISVDDVSEIRHNIVCKVSGVDDFSSVKVTRCGRNLLTPGGFTNGTVVEFNGITCFEYIDGANRFEYRSGFKQDTIYTLTIKMYRKAQFETMSASFKFCYTDGTESSEFPLKHGEVISMTSDPGKTIDYIRGTYNFSSYVYIDLTVSCLNEGAVALPYEPYNGQTLIPNSDGTVDGMTSISPYVIIFTDNKDAVLEVIYNKKLTMVTS